MSLPTLLPAVSAFIQRAPRMLVGGAWVEAADGLHRTMCGEIGIERMQHAPVGLGKERKALGHQFLVGGGLAQAQLRAVVAHPAVEHRADQLPVLVH